MSAPKPWTTEEDALMREYYPQGIDIACEHIPNHGRFAIREHARHLGVRVSQEARTASRKARMLGAPAPVKPREPFVMTREYEQAQSIWQVGYRFHIQREAA
jgi:hypothetical protein